MDKKSRREMETQLMSFTETLEILYEQESQLLELIAKYQYNDILHHHWVAELFMSADYVCKLKEASDIIKQQLNKR